MPVWIMKWHSSLGSEVLHVIRMMNVVEKAAPDSIPNIMPSTLTLAEIKMVVEKWPFSLQVT